MKFNCFGNKNNPCMVFVHGMGAIYYASYRFAKYFQDKFYLIIPTLDDHDDSGDTIKNTEYEARKIINYLKENNINKLVLYHGTSMGAIIGMKFLELNEVEVDNYFFDGGPFMKGRFVLKKTLSMIVKKIIKDFDKKSFDELVESSGLKNDENVNFEELYPQYKSVFKNYLTGNTIYRLFGVCFSCEFPKLDIQTQKKIRFFYSTGEPPRLSRKRLMKNYPNSIFLDWEGKGHTEFQGSKPKEYYQYLLKNLNL